MNLRDLFASDDPEQRERVDGPSLHEVSTRQVETLFHGEDPDPNPNLPGEFDPGFWAHLPGDERSHPGLPSFNPYLFVPGSELAFLLKHNKGLSAESRARISEALAMQASG